MSQIASNTASRRRGSSSSTVKASQLPEPSLSAQQSVSEVNATLRVHEDSFSSEDILINELIFEGSSIQEGALIEVSSVQDSAQLGSSLPANDEHSLHVLQDDGTHIGADRETTSRWLCFARFAQAELKAKNTSLQVSIKSTIANAFGFRQGAQVRLRSAVLEESTASHVEFSFRDTYLARSDMWRLIGQELSGKTVYTGQRITFLGTIKLTVKAIHVNGHKASTAYFSGLTHPIFRSEAARYVIFIQMSREMWDFDSEGNGEILFNRVINGFLPELFKRWNELEVRHLVSIVLFGRQEYRRFDFTPRRDISAALAPPIPSLQHHGHYQDFYRVVVTDMASAQWTTILDELKKDFRVFLRDISLHPPPQSSRAFGELDESKRITGRPSTAMKGNFLEAINIAATQFSSDYVDRDLIRTGISVVVVTAGTGVFEVDRDLLNLTSQNLTNNGIGIDIVCLSKMPLHSVPLFKYRPNSPPERGSTNLSSEASSPLTRPRLHGLSATQSQTDSPAVSSFPGQGMYTGSRYSSSLRLENPWAWCYGIPHWIDLSYWAPEFAKAGAGALKRDDSQDLQTTNQQKGPFVPRVRMYEVQMMGLMEMGMADISIPWMSETQSYKSSRRRRKTSTMQEWFGSRSLSHSPNLSRRGIRLESPSYKNRNSPPIDAKTLSDTFLKMDNYDAALFRQVVRSSLTSPLKRSKEPIIDPASSPEKPVKGTKAIEITKSAEAVAGDEPKTLPPHSPASSELSSMLSQKRNAETARAVRSTSYALRGLAPPMRAIPSTEVNVENALAHLPRGATTKARPTVGVSTDSFRALSMHSTGSQTQGPLISQGNHLSPVPSQVDGERPSTPIRIQKPDGGTGAEKLTTTPSRETNSGVDVKSSARKANRSDADSVSHSSEDASDSDGSVSFNDFESLATSIPKSNVPFVRNVNASNPLKGNPNREAFFGRWQHLYPRKPRAATVKWRSLCTPASVPLTTEGFPSKDILDSEFESSSYTIGLESTNELLENPESRDELFREMLALRFAHGYQLVVGPRMNRYEGPNVGDPSFFFNPNAIRTDGHFSFMSMGNTIQKLSLIEKNQIGVTRYVRKVREVQPAFSDRIDYSPHIRTILSDRYLVRKMHLQGFTEEYPWELADRYLSAANKDLDHEVELLRFWRARFVLLPVEPPANAFRPTATDSEENEEEIHLRGIRALTQMWQRARYILPDERRPAHNRISAFKKKDRNPLRINMGTLNPSELVATELDKLLAAEEAGDVQTAQLLPEEEQFERETASLSKLAAALQGERGIEIKNRRWHLRLHYSCFLGEDFTNWLVQNFRNIDTRDEAIELGNELMKEGLFEHVNSRHNFKDGNYFYSIKSEYRALQPELRQSWFPASRRSDRSVPPTPLSETASREPPLSARSRSGSSLATALNSQPANSTDTNKLSAEKSGKRLAVSLSKAIRLDVDVRRRSNRPEIVNLHYDRLHNPENCYHLELSWLNVTSKLVDDAITSWTTQAERYGLKLVEVPIAEMCKVPESEPFRAPYRIKLISDPPQRPSNGPNGNGNAYFTATSFTPLQPVNNDFHFYQKHLLKRFNFVLDLEAVSEFPENVEINYSWGKLEYEYTQFVHRSGVVLAQITDEGDILLLANRLYNSRLASAKDTGGKFDKRDNNNSNPSMQGLRPPAIPPSTAMQASGIVGVNVQSPVPTPTPVGKEQMPLAGAASPLPLRPADHTDRPGERISADVLGSRRALGSSGLLAFVTPEQIKDDLEEFCRDKERLETFYRDVTAMVAQAQGQAQGQGQPGTTAGPGAGVKRAGTGGTSSSLLRPVKESDMELELESELGLGIPEFKLPESVAGMGAAGRRQRTN